MKSWTTKFYSEMLAVVMDISAGEINNPPNYYCANNKILHYL